MKELKGQRILVTGGGGFIGASLVEILLENGSIPVIFDSRSIETCVRNIGCKPGVEYIQGDIRNQKVLEGAFDRIAGVVHLAAVVSVPICTEQPEMSYEVNVLGAQKVFEAYSKLGRGPFVFASSAAVYGDPFGKKADAVRPISETSSVQPISNYGSHKLEFERFLEKAATTTSNGPITALRFFNVYGVGQDPTSPYSGVITQFVRRIQKGERIQVFGDGKQVRDFVWVGDVGRAVLAALTREEGPFRVFNVGSGVATSLLDLLKRLGQKPEGGQVDFGPERVGDIRFSQAEVSLIQRELDFEALVKEFDPSKI